MELLKYEDYENMDLLDIKEALTIKTLELVKEIIKEKNIDVDEYSYIDNEYEKIYYMFYYDINLCTDVKYLIKHLTYGFDEDDCYSDTYKNWITNYNYLVEEFNYYLKTKEEINTRTYEVVYKELMDNLKSLCKEMFSYKHKEHNDNISLGRNLDKLKTYYHYYILTFSELSSGIVGYANGENIDEQPRRLDNAEKIIIIRSCYNYLKNNYKEHAFDYNDYELKEGQTFSDLYMEYLERNYSLYRKMLDYLNVEYDKSRPPIHVIDKVKEYYPFYIKYIDDLDRPYFDPYASLLTRMDKYYDIMSKNYKKDFKNEINRYIKHKDKLNMTTKEIEKIREIIDKDIKLD